MQIPIIGLQKLYVAKLRKDDETGVEFEKPVYLEGIKELGIKPKLSNDEFYAEDKLWCSDTSIANIDVEVNITDLSEENEAMLLGHKIAESGGIIYNADDKAPVVAVLFKATKQNGKGRFICLYRGTFSIADDENYKSKEGKANFQTKKLKATFAPLHHNSMWKYKTDEENNMTDEKFFANVIIPTEKIEKGK